MTVQHHNHEIMFFNCKDEIFGWYLFTSYQLNQSVETFEAMTKLLYTSTDITIVPRSYTNTIILWYGIAPQQWDIYFDSKHDAMDETYAWTSYQLNQSVKTFEAMTMLLHINDFSMVPQRTCKYIHQGYNCNL